MQKIKRFKKMLALVLTLAMLASMCLINAFADEPSSVQSNMELTIVSPTWTVTIPTNLNVAPLGGTTTYQKYAAVLFKITTSNLKINVGSNSALNIQIKGVDPSGEPESNDFKLYYSGAEPDINPLTYNIYPGQRFGLSDSKQNDPEIINPELSGIYPISPTAAYALKYERVLLNGSDVIKEEDNDSTDPTGDTIKKYLNVVKSTDPENLQATGTILTTETILATEDYTKIKTAVSEDPNGNQGYNEYFTALINTQTLSTAGTYSGIIQFTITCGTSEE